MKRKINHRIDTVVTRVDDLRDLDVRIALRSSVLSKHQSEPDTLVIEELGIRHGTVRVDVAVVNGSIHGFEIKSDVDTLARLPRQVELYSAVMDRATLVVGERHAKAAQSLLPDWWGVDVVCQGNEGKLSFQELQEAHENPAVNPLAVAELLWSNEVCHILGQLGFLPKQLRKPRAFLYREIAEFLHPDDLRAMVRSTLKKRENWRDRSPLS
jgi:hypothetical protein